MAFNIGANPSGNVFETGTLARPGHQLGIDTGEVNPLHIEQYGGEVESQIVKTSIMNGWVPMKPVRGTDTITNDRIGKTSLQKVTPGVRPESGEVQFDNISLKVDTIVLARNNVHLLDDFQEHYSTRVEIGEDHGKEIGKFWDEAFFIQGMKAARISGVTLPGWSDGTVTTLTSANDELDPDKLQRAIEDTCQAIEEKDVDLEGFVIFVAPAQYYVLLRNDRLTTEEYSMGNGNVAKGKVLESCGLPVVKTNRLAQNPAGETGHYLSNAGNGNAYDYSAAEAKGVCLIMTPKAMLAGETIPLTSKVYYSDIELQWFIDSYLAFGVTPNRGEYAAIIDKV